MVRSYSSGMRVRLAFSIATSIRPDVFLLDEMLAVGDEFFAERSFERIREIAAGGRATVIASHDWNQTFRLCTRIVWLEDGRVRADGRPHEMLFDIPRVPQRVRADEAGRDRAGRRLRRRRGARRTFCSGEPLHVRIWYRPARRHRSHSSPASSHRYNGQDDPLASGAATTASWSRPRAQGSVELRYPTLPLVVRRVRALRRARRARARSLADASPDMWIRCLATTPLSRWTAPGREGYVDLPATWSTGALVA